MKSIRVLAVLLFGCGGATSQTVDEPTPATASTTPEATPVSPAPSSSPSASSSTPSPSPPPTSSTDGTATRATCTSSFGNALSASFGRLDGYVYAIVPTGTRDCNADGSHLHLQVKSDGAVYDVAVNLDALQAETTHAMSAWSEGWHAGAESLDYPTDLALHANAFAAKSSSAARSDLEAALASANHISIFATGYGPNGAHLVHRQGGGHDGAIVIDPLSSAPRVIAFRFDKDAF